MITLANRAPLRSPVRDLTLEQRKNAMTNEGDPILSQDAESPKAIAEPLDRAVRQTLSLPQAKPTSKT